MILLFVISSKVDCLGLVLNLNCNKKKNMKQVVLIMMPLDFSSKHFRFNSKLLKFNRLQNHFVYSNNLKKKKLKRKFHVRKKYDDDCIFSFMYYIFIRFK